MLFGSQCELTKDERSCLHKMVLLCNCAMGTRNISVLDYVVLLHGDAGNAAKAVRAKTCGGGPGLL